MYSFLIIIIIRLFISFFFGGGGVMCDGPGLLFDSFMDWFMVVFIYCKYFLQDGILQIIGTKSLRIKSWLTSNSFIMLTEAFHMICPIPGPPGPTPQASSANISLVKWPSGGKLNASQNQVQIFTRRQR